MIDFCRIGKKLPMRDVEGAVPYVLASGGIKKAL